MGLCLREDYLPRHGKYRNFSQVSPNSHHTDSSRGPGGGEKQLTPGDVLGDPHETLAKQLLMGKGSAEKPPNLSSDHGRWDEDEWEWEFHAFPHRKQSICLQN